jgi:hypothetical protein
VVISHADNVQRLQEEIVGRFAREVKQHYSFIDRERGYVLVPDAMGERRVDLMALSVGAVSTQTHRFADIREITELAAEDRRRRLSGLVDTDDTPLQTSW